MAQQAKSASMGRSPSEDFIKRRKSWQAHEQPPHVQRPPDVRQFLGRQLRPKETSHTGIRESCAELPWQKVIKFILTTFAVLLLAGVTLSIVAVASHSSYAYTQWMQARDGTTYYIAQVDRYQALTLFATFFGAVLIVLSSYALFSAVLNRLEARREAKRVAGLNHASDLEQGDSPIKTKQSIAKLMSDAEKQYVAEYMRKMSGPGSARKQQGGSQSLAGSQVRSASVSEHPKDPAGALPLQSWSFKRILPLGKAEHDVTPPQERGAGNEVAVHSSEVAAQLSSPDAFNRASSSHASLHKFDDGGARQPELSQQGTGSMTPSTPTMGELMRQRREGYAKRGDTDDGSPFGSTRIMVTRPVEAHGEGSAESDSDVEDYDRERQHSILPHRAGDPPFGAQVLGKSQQLGVEQAGVAGSLGWQDIGLESDEESHRYSLEPQPPPGHIFMDHSLNPQRSAEIKPCERAELHAMDSLDVAEDKIRYFVSVDFEEVLPRPQAGLLNRLLRLARVESVNLPGRGPAFVIQPGKEYMVGLRLRQVASTDRQLCAKWIRIQPPDGQPVRFNVEEECCKPDEWSGSACWDTSLHSSEALDSPTQACGPGSISISITIGLELVGKASHKLEAFGTMHVILQDVAHSRQVGVEGHSSAPKTTATATFYLL